MAVPLFSKLVCPCARGAARLYVLLITESSHSRRRLTNGGAPPSDRSESMIASILGKLDSLGDQHPHRVLYSYIDVNGNPIGGYSYESFLHRTKVIAGHLRKEHGFLSQDRLLLAYPPGLEMICAFFGCVRAGLIPVPVYPPSSRGFQGALYKMVHIAKDCQAAGILTSKDYLGSLKSNLARSGVSASGVDADYISSLRWIVQKTSSIRFLTKPSTAGATGPGPMALRRFCFCSTR